MKNLEYIRKYQLFIAEEIGKRPIDNEDNQRKFLSDFYFDYKANLELIGIQQSVKKYDQVYFQMKQKLDSLAKKTPYDLPKQFYQALDNFYWNFCKEYCPLFYLQIEEIEKWEYVTYQYYDSRYLFKDRKEDKFLKLFDSYNFSYRRNDHNFSKYPKIVEIAYNIYLRKKKEFEIKEKEEQQKREEEYQRRMKSDPGFFFKENFRRSYFYNSFFEYAFLFASIMKAQKPVTSFSILGLSDNATIEEVKSAYRILAIKYHPDKGGDKEKFIEITEAKEKCLAYLN